MENKYQTKAQKQASFNDRLHAHTRAGSFGGMPEKSIVPTIVAEAEPVRENGNMAQPKSANFFWGSTGMSRFMFATGFDGEKNLGELGPIKSYFPLYDFLRLRSWQAMMESELAQIVMGRYLTWVVGSGLKLQAEPSKRVLKDEGITLDVTDFSETVESRFSVFADLKETDYARMNDLNTQASDALKNAIIGGDVLVVLRYESKNITLQLIDGCHVVSPPGQPGNDIFAPVLPNGNRIINGIELSPKNQHIAYYVRKSALEGNEQLSFETVRIAARGTGKNDNLVTAFMIYGSKYRLDNHRGLPLIGVMLETMKKLERYKEATVGSAEERAKVPWTIEHALGSTGENPMMKQIATAWGTPDEDIPATIEGQRLADKVAATTNKSVYNLPIASKMTALDSKQEINFPGFYGTNIDIFCAAIEIPPNVAMQKYDANFSASRAALKDWEHTLQVKRKNFQRQFYQNVYNFWMDIQIMIGVIVAPGYLQAKFSSNYMVMGAYRKCRFVGASVPHIDPVKEVTAERMKLGVTGAAIPLTTAEAATESLNGGDFNANLEQYEDELARTTEAGIEVPVPAGPAEKAPAKVEA